MAFSTAEPLLLVATAPPAPLPTVQVVTMAPQLLEDDDLQEHDAAADLAAPNDLPEQDAVLAAPSTQDVVTVREEPKKRPRGRPPAGGPREPAFFCPSPGCGKSYASYGGLYLHKRAYHPELLGDRAMPTGHRQPGRPPAGGDREPTFFCPVEDCGKAFCSYGGLYLHKRTHHDGGAPHDPNNEAKRPRGRPPAGGPREPAFFCPVEGCGKSYASYGGLYQHKRAKHPDLIQQKPGLAGEAGPSAPALVPAPRPPAAAGGVAAVGLAPTPVGAPPGRLTGLAASAAPLDAPVASLVESAACLAEPVAAPLDGEGPETPATSLNASLLLAT